MFSQKFVQTGLKNTRLVKKRYLRANHKSFTNVTLKSCNAQKMSVFGVILVRIQSECRKIKTRITPNTGTFHAVSKGIMARAKPRNYLKKKNGGNRPLFCKQRNKCVSLLQKAKKIILQV